MIKESVASRILLVVQVKLQASLLQVFIITHMHGQPPFRTAGPFEMSQIKPRPVSLGEHSLSYTRKTSHNFTVEPASQIHQLHCARF